MGSNPTSGPLTQPSTFFTSDQIFYLPVILCRLCLMTMLNAISTYLDSRKAILQGHVTVNRTIDYYLKRGSHASLISVKLSTGSTREFRNPWGQLLETVSTNVRGG